ncbi:multicopper oxidase domain-containing protein [Oceanicoccus sp. KOV_DT_Chl]|uniref:multicopper oxidase domain-containing protein n=1 Tax=Oceanicoccus sp. KOV_DT_Chl TaxID=1904639 RepID=UPI000C7D88F5|nr:multicopper oxidase domain-containing protein [Oceanicoccus sp. KOV_DT_Chl]
MKSLLCFTLFLFSLSALAVERLYYVAADEVIWDYAPVKRNLMMDMALLESQRVFVDTTDSTIGSQYKKALFREYTDATFSTLKPRPPEEQHLGLLGPLFRAEVGDTIKVVFKNQASRHYSIHPHGVFYTKANEGAMTNDGTTGADKKDDMVMPGETYTYEWQVRESAGPGPADNSSVVWLYHSHVRSIQDSNTGLIGAIIVTEKGMATADGRPNDVDREFINLYTVMNENESWYLDDNIQRTLAAAPKNEDDFEEGNLKHVINGYLFANLPGLDMVEGETVRWHLLALGTEVDLHTPHWHGHTGLHNGHRTDVIELLPASMKTLDMVIDNPGTWMYHCHVNDHIAAGMTALYHVKAKLK